MRPGWQEEKRIWKRGQVLCGVDEVGTGALAGPVYAGAVIFESYVRVPELMDSKLLRPDERVRSAAFLMQHCLWAVGSATPEEIATLGLRGATLEAMRRAVLGLPRKPHKILIDAWNIPDLDIPQEGIIRGDYAIASIAAASIIAKYHRDRLMEQYGREFPGYGFGDHKGYATKEHQEAILKLGPSVIHRLSYNIFKK